MTTMAASCSCYNNLTSPSCQLFFDEEIQALTCKSDVTSLCLSAIEVWVKVFKTSDFANHGCIDEEIIEGYATLQKTWQSCVPMSNQGIDSNTNK